MVIIFICSIFFYTYQNSSEQGETNQEKCLNLAVLTWLVQAEINKLTQAAKRQSKIKAAKMKKVFICFNLKTLRRSLNNRYDKYDYTTHY